MGVWIEIYSSCVSMTFPTVTPFMGVWIEITQFDGYYNVSRVTPFMGVWIEIYYMPSSQPLF